VATGHHNPKAQPPFFGRTKQIQSFSKIAISYEHFVNVKVAMISKHLAKCIIFCAESIWFFLALKQAFAYFDISVFIPVSQDVCFITADHKYISRHFFKFSPI